MRFQWKLRTSRWQRWFLFGCHALALAAVGLSGLPPWWAAGVGLLVIVGWLLRRRKPERMQLLAYYDGYWEVLVPGQPVRRGRLCPSTWMTPWLTLLHLRLENGRFLAVAVWCDSLSMSDYRRLQRVLRWYCR